MSQTLSPASDGVETPAQSHRRTIFGIGVGNALEWFDWGIYAIFAPFFATQLFDPAHEVSAFLATLAVFAVGFLFRPLGGLLFGWLADRRGRKFSMTAAVGASAVGALLIGLAPTYGQVGVLASVVLVVARLVQGLAHGGELPSAQTYVSEYAPSERRGLWSSLIYISGTLGNVVGILVGAVLAGVLSADAMASYGWRIPFVIGGLFGLYALYMRSRMVETAHFTEGAASSTAAGGPSMWREIVRHRRQGLQVVGMTMGMTVGFYTWAIATAPYAIKVLKIDASAALWASLAANLVFILALPVWGSLSDRLGRKPVLLVGVAGLAISTVPAFLLIHDSAWQLLVGMTIPLIFMAAPCAIVPAVFAELFPTHIRTIGVGIPYSICVAAFGGTAPYLLTWMSSHHGPSSFHYYLIGLLVISALVVVSIPESRGRRLEA